MALFIWCSLQLLLSSFCLPVCDTLFSITTFSCAWLSASYTFKRTVHGGSILLPLSKFPGLWCSSILGQDNFLSVSYWCHNPHLPIFCVSGLQSNKICLEFLFQLGWWPSVTCTSHRQFLWLPSKVGVFALLWSSPLLVLAWSCSDSMFLQGRSIWAHNGKCPFDFSFGHVHTFSNRQTYTVWHAVAAGSEVRWFFFAFKILAG